MPASPRCSNRRFTTSPGPRPSLTASSPTVNGPGSSISAVTTGGAATGAGGGGGGRRSLTLGGRSFGGAPTGAGAGAGDGAAPGSTGARGGWGDRKSTRLNSSH